MSTRAQSATASGATANLCARKLSIALVRPCRHASHSRAGHQSPRALGQKKKSMIRTSDGKSLSQRCSFYILKRIPRDHVRFPRDHVGFPRGFPCWCTQEACRRRHDINTDRDRRQTMRYSSAGPQRSRLQLVSGSSKLEPQTF